MEVLAKRTVSEELQERFAALCGDRNPMHMDAVAARRTQAGLPVVHGIHTLLWALETLAEQGLLTEPPARVRVRFLKWVYVGDEAELVVAREPNPGSFEVRVMGLAVLAADMTFGEREPAREDVGIASPEAPLTVARDLAIEQMEGVAGDVYVAPGQEAAQMFPQLAQRMGGSALAEIAACSYLVGMEAPGLHSMFSKADLRFTEPGEGIRQALHWEVTYTDARFRKARIAVQGGVVSGTLEVFFRVPPVQQASMEQLTRHVTAGEFAGMRALVIGGSRGLGELTAKLIAAGGGVPVITYALGKAEADKIAGEIRAVGAEVATLQYDVLKPPAPQLEELGMPPTHLFYFATNAIFRPKGELVSPSMLASFMTFYVTGFYNLCVLLANARAPEDRLTVYYPSSIAVLDRPEGMTEYSMAKAAGEVMCEDLNRFQPGLRIMSTRLPRLLTDQTASVLPGREQDPVEVMLPILRAMKAVRRE